MIFLIQNNNFPFILALTIVCSLALVEIIGLLCGIGVSHWLSKLIPDQLIEGLHTEHGIFAEFVSWLKLKEIPFAIALILWLILFGCCGLILQFISYKTIATTLNSYLASTISLLISTVIMRQILSLLSNTFRKTQSSAIGCDSLIGRVAIIVQGVARHGMAAQAKVQDEYGLSHYVLVEPDIKSVEFNHGDNVLLVERNNSIYYVIALN